MTVDERGPSCRARRTSGGHAFAAEVVVGVYGVAERLVDAGGRLRKGEKQARTHYDTHAARMGGHVQE